MDDIVYLNGDFVAKSNAKISVLDRGFLFGDAIYEVIPVYQSKPFRLNAHLDRLNDCLKQVNIANPYSVSVWTQLIEQIVAKNNQPHLSIYIQVTRGQQPDRNHTFSEKLDASVLIMPNPLSTTVAELAPIKALLTEDIRWQYCDIKNTSLLANILLRQQAENSGFDEALLHRQGQLTEGATSNIFAVKDNTIYTPVKDQFILGGITRELIIELAKKASILVKQTAITTEQLFDADEIWISSSSREISPVTQINDKIIANGEIGPVTKKLHKAFQVFKQALIDD